MNTTLLGLNSSTLNNDLIEKLKNAEINLNNKYLNQNLEKLNESKIITEQFFNQINKIRTLSNEKTINYSANTTGNNIVINIEDETKIKEGYYSFNVYSIAKREVYQSIEFSDENNLIGNEILNIKGIEINTTGKTFKEISSEINSIEGVISNIENVSNNSKRIIIKSELPGEENALNINNLLLTKTQSASNLNINVEGINFNLNNNNLIYNGLKISISDTGISSINIIKDNSQEKEKFNNLISEYNNLVSYFNNTILYNEKFKGDKTIFNETIKNIKDIFFNNELFSLGASLDKTGNISTNEIPLESMNKFNKDIKILLTELTEEKGSINKYKNSQNLEKNNIEKEIEKNLNNLNKKYEELASYFISYTKLISSFELNFSSLKQLIELKNN
jgi:hypothetical protein